MHYLSFVSCLLNNNLRSVRDVHVYSDFWDVSLARTGARLLLLSGGLLNEFLSAMEPSWVFLRGAYFLIKPVRSQTHNKGSSPTTLILLSDGGPPNADGFVLRERKLR